MPKNFVKSTREVTQIQACEIEELHSDMKRAGFSGMAVSEATKTKRKEQARERKFLSNLRKQEKELRRRKK